MKSPSSLIPLALLLLSPVVAAAPRAAKAPDASHVFSGKPEASRGTSDDGDATIPSTLARASAASAVLGKSVAIKMVWGSVSPRRPKDDKAALVFTRADIVDAKRNLATWMGTSGGSSGGGGGGGFPATIDDICVLFGCPGGSDGGGDRGMQLWMNVVGNERYYAECRVRFEGKKGAMAVKADGFDAAFNVDHTGKNFGRVGWVIDPSAPGWVGFTMSSTTGWTTYGCTLDQLD